MRDNDSIELRHVLMLAIISSISLIIVSSLSHGIPNRGSIVFAVSNSTNPTLPPVQLESVDPQDTDDSNSASGISEANNTDYLSYEDPDIGISLKYPQNWNIDKESNENFNVASFDSPDKEVNVDVRVFPSRQYDSIKEYGDKTFKNSDDYTLLQYYRNSTTLLSGKPAFKVVYLTTTNPGLFGNVLGASTTTSKAMMVATLVPEKKSIFAVVYFADSSNFGDYLPEVEGMVKSFQISDKGPIIQEED